MVQLLKLFAVQNFQLAPVPADQYGCFFDGDSYLILAVRIFCSLPPKVLSAVPNGFSCIT
jgi:hypothetical protein